MYLSIFNLFIVGNYNHKIDIYKRNKLSTRSNISMSHFNARVISLPPEIRVRYQFMVLIEFNPKHIKNIYYYKNNNSNNIRDKNGNSNERKWSYCLKVILLFVCKFYIISMDIRRVSYSLFLFRRCQGSLILSIPLVLKSIFLGIKKITIQYRGIQSVLNIFKKYCFYEDFTNFQTQMFLLGLLQAYIGKF